jgi:hypothetical protein
MTWKTLIWDWLFQSGDFYHPTVMNKKPLHLVLTSILTATLATGLLGCEKSQTEKAVEKTEDAAKATGNAVERVLEKTGEAIETAVEKTGEVVKTGAEKTKEGIEKAVEKVEETVD